MKTDQVPPQPEVMDGDASAMAGTLQELLLEISSSVSLADSRYADIIGQMQQKLSALDTLAKTKREQAEEQARREAEAEAEAQRIAETKRQAEVDARLAAEAAARKQQADAEAAEAKRLAEAVEAAKAAASSAIERAKSASYPPDVDPFDIIDHSPTRSRDPWDSESADVFARHFEQVEAGIPQPIRVPLQIAPVPPQVQLKSRASHEVLQQALHAVDAGADRAWLEGRFNDIATRISEMMVSGDTSELGARFDNLEGRIDAAMTTVTTHAATGSDTLKMIEAHIAEIDEHVDFIRSELARLDGVEAQIRSLMDKQKAAETQAAARQQLGSDGDASNLVQLTDLLQRLTSERRHTEEHTVSMLDTLQQAMIRVLDRVEAMETAPASSPPTELAKSEPEPEPDAQPEVHAAEPTQEPAPAAHSATSAANDSYFIDFDDDDTNADLTRAAAHASDPALTPELQSSILQIRRNFIADAQRARQRAAESGLMTAPAAAQPRPSREKLTLLERLMRPTTKQLAVAALSLMIPLNCMFLYLVLGTSKPQEPQDFHAATEEASARPATQLTEASQALASEPPMSQSEPLPASEGLGRISAPATSPEPIALQQPVAETEPTSKIELPPATVGPLTLRRAAADGDASAQFEVAARLAEGKGIDQNFKIAVEWYLRSASHGFAQAQYRLGTHYERGLGVDKDPERARIWYERAAEQGNVKAMHNLAVLATTRPDGKPDYAQAIKWFTDAAQYNLPDSQFNLAVLYENGLGIDKDPKAAYLWFSLAARSGDKEAIKRRDTVKSLLSADALAAAEEEVRVFRTKPQLPVINDARVAGEQWKKRQASAN